jgi:hypothetical protein
MPRADTSSAATKNAGHSFSRRASAAVGFASGSPELGYRGRIPERRRFGDRGLVERDETVA